MILFEQLLQFYKNEAARHENQARESALIAKIYREAASKLDDAIEKEKKK
jgi:hypothetical protein